MKWTQTAAIDYPNSRPHVGTAFEKVGADVQARYRRTEGYDVSFLMGNDENTVKVAQRAAELGVGVQNYCDDMADQFRAVWGALGVSHDRFIQTSKPDHHALCREFARRVHDAGYIRKGEYTGLYCPGCESFKSEPCEYHAGPLVSRREECYYFEQSRFRDRLLALYADRPEFIQPEARRNEMVALVTEGLQDLNITRLGEAWGVRVPWDERFTLYVWFDALLTYLQGPWPCDVHFIGKDITRFHCTTWPAMLMAAGMDLPARVFGHGFVSHRSATGEVERQSKSLGNVVDPMEIVAEFGADAFRYYFMRECPFPGDGEFSRERFRAVYAADLANNLGNLYSRLVALIARNCPTLPRPRPVVDLGEVVRAVRGHVESCHYHQALGVIWRQLLDPANRMMESSAPWHLVKSDAVAGTQLLADLLDLLRSATTLLQPFLPNAANTILGSFNFDPGRNYASAGTTGDRELRLIVAHDNGKVKPLFLRV